MRSRIAARHLVARRELVGEAPAGGVEQRRALAADRLGDQGAVVRAPGQRERGRVELAELEVGELGARRRGRAPRRRRSRPRGWSSAATARRRRRSPARSPAPAIAPRSVITPAQRPPSLHSATRRGPLQHLDPRLGGDQLGEPRGDRAAGLAAAGVDDPARRVAALEAERELAVGLEVEAHAAARCSSSTAAGASRVEHLDRARAAQPAAGVERVVGVAPGRVVGGAAPRRARPGPRSSSSRRAACARPGRRARRARPPRARRAGRRRRRRPPRRQRASDARSRAGYRTRRPMALYVSHPSSLEHDTGRAPRERGPASAIEAALDRAGWLGLERVEAPAATREQLTRVHDAGARRRDRGLLRARRRHDRPRHGRQRRLLRGRAARRRRRGGRGCERLLAGEATAAAFCGLRPPGHHAERDRAMGFCLFNNVAVAAAARARRLRRRARLDPRLGRPPRQRHRGDLRRLRPRCSTRASTSGRSIRAPARPSTPATGEGEGYTVNLPVPPGAGGDEFLALVQHVVAPIARALRARPDRDLGRLRRPPRRPARLVRGRHRGLRRRWRRRMRDLAARARGAGAGLPRGRLRPTRSPRRSSRRSRRSRGDGPPRRRRPRPPSPIARGLPQRSATLSSAPRSARARRGCVWIGHRRAPHDPRVNPRKEAACMQPSHSHQRPRFGRRCAPTRRRARPGDGRVRRPDPAGLDADGRHGRRDEGLQRPRAPRSPR